MMKSTSSLAYLEVLVKACSDKIERLRELDLEQAHRLATHIDINIGSCILNISDLLKQLDTAIANSEKAGGK